MLEAIFAFFLFVDETCLCFVYEFYFVATLKISLSITQFAVDTFRSFNDLAKKFVKKPVRLKDRLKDKGSIKVVVKMFFLGILKILSDFPVFRIRFLSIFR